MDCSGLSPSALSLLGGGVGGAMRPEVPALLRAEAVRSVLAYCVVAGGLLLLAVAWLTGAPDVERLAVAVVGLVGLVLGYYFGSRSSA